MKLWLNGRLIDAADARIDVADRGFTLGDGVFETIKAVGGQPRLLAAHLQRLRAGAEYLEIPVPYEDSALASAMIGTLAANQLSQAVLRLTLTRGPAPRGVLPPLSVTPTLLISAAPLPPSALPARAVICGAIRRNEYSPLCRIKSLNYLDNIIARQEAAKRGADEALLLNTAGRLAEASSANLFVQKGQVLLTPPVSDGALPGIMRQKLLACGAIEHRLEAGDLRHADLVFLSSSLSLRMLSEIDGQPLRGDAEKLNAIAARLDQMD